MELSAPLPVDLGGALVGAVVGLFIGFSGALAFLVSTAAAIAFGYFAWGPITPSIPSVPLRGLVVGLAALLVLGLVRWIIKKCVHGLIAQPGDAIFGALVGGGALLVIIECVWKVGCRYF